MAKRREIAALTLALFAATVAGCGKKESGSKPARTEQSAKALGATSATPAAKPSTTPADLRATPVAAAESIRKIASSSLDPTALAPFFDPSQASNTSTVLAPMLVYFARLADLRRAAHEAFGSGAGDVVSSSAAYTVEFGNGIREMFDAHHFEDVRRHADKAYVMATLADGQPIGAPIVFREHQGEWLLLLCNGDDPWPESRLATYGSTLAGPLKGALEDAKAFESLVSRIRSGEIATLEALTAAMGAIRQG